MGELLCPVRMSGKRQKVHTEISTAIDGGVTATVHEGDRVEVVKGRDMRMRVQRDQEGARPVMSRHISYFIIYRKEWGESFRSTITFRDLCLLF